MIRDCSRLTIAAFLPLMVAVGVTAPAQAQTFMQQSAVKLEKLPYSGDVLMARAIRAGRVHWTNALAPPPPANPPRLTCTPAPCPLPNVQASPGGQPAVETPMVAGPVGTNSITPTQTYNSSHSNTANLRPGPSPGCSPSMQGYDFTKDGGSKWQHTCGALANGANGGGGDPIIGYDLNRTVYRGGIDTLPNGLSEVVVSSCPDPGKTCSAPVVATAVPNLFVDKPWMEIDTTPSSPFRDNIYISSTIFASNNDSQIYVSRSTDHGTTWNTVPVGVQVLYPNVIQFSDMAVGTDGTVYLTAMFCTANGPMGDCGGTSATMYVFKSSDSGNTWSTAVVVGTVALAPDACGCAFYGSLPNTPERVSDIPVIAIDNSSGTTSGRLYVVDYNWTGAYMRVQVTASNDGGATWSTPVWVAKSIDEVTGDEFFPWINVSAEGQVGVTWLDRRNDPSNINYDAFGAVSTDGGLTYPNLKLSTVSSNPFNDGYGGSFMGEYTGNAWMGKNLVMSWPDSRNGVNMQDVVGGELP